MSRPRLWTKDFVIDASTNLIVYLVYNLLMITIASHAMESFHATPSCAGLACGIFVIGAVISRILTGREIDRVGRRKTLYVGLVFYFLTTLLYFAAGNIPLLLVIRFLHGVGFGISGTATGTIAAGVIPASRRGEGISYYAMSATLASAIGPSIGIFLSSRGDFNAIIIVAAALIIVSLAAVLFMRTPEIKLTQEQLEDLKGFKLTSLFEKRAIPVSTVSIFIGLGISSILGFLASFSKEISLAGAGELFFIVYAAAILVSRPLTGVLFDRKGENYVLYPSFVVFAVGLGMLSFAHNSLALLLAGAAAGLGYGTYLSAAQAIAVKVSPSHRMGLATSTFFSFLDGGVGIGPFLLGCTIPFIGLRGMYASMAVVVLACSFLYHVLHGGKAVARVATECGVEESASY